MSDSTQSVQEVRRFGAIKSISMCQGYVAVYAMESKSNPSKLTLEESPIDAFAIAEVFAITINENGKAIGQEREDDEIVGLELDGGVWMIVNADSNFSGFARAGEDISAAIGHLEGELYAQLEKLSPED